MNDDVAREIAEALGDRLVGWCEVAGGDINAASVVDLRSAGRIFVKTPPVGARFAQSLYPAEASGLTWLREANALRVPSVLAVAPGWLALEHVEAGRPAPDYDERLGRGLALLHRCGAKSFGYANDNFIGSLAQANAPTPDWPTFYGERRLLPQLALACSRGVDPRLSRRIEFLCANLASWAGPSEAPSRLHGDLWSGNAFADGDGQPVLVDPAVYGGHREIDLAMMTLFGGFSARVFDAYDEAFALAPGWRRRLTLYQLYPLLVHVNLFGGGYVRQLEAAVTRCGG